MYLPTYEIVIPYTTNGIASLVLPPIIFPSLQRSRRKGSSMLDQLLATKRILDVLKPCSTQYYYDSLTFSMQYCIRIIIRYMVLDYVRNRDLNQGQGYFGYKVDFGYKSRFISKIGQKKSVYIHGYISKWLLEARIMSVIFSGKAIHVSTNISF